MSFPQYESCKDSGVEFLGEVPEEWQVIPLKRDLHFLTSGSRGWADYYADDGALFIRIGNLTRESSHLDLTDIQRVAVPEGSEGERTVVRSGDVLFSITAYLGSVAVVPDDLELAYVSQHVALARLKGQYLLPEWVAYVTLSNIGKTYLETRGYGGTKIQLSLDDVANLTMTVPPIHEQAIITEFLKRESVKIETLIAEQERLIALLKEKRQAVISHAVTKGLNPDAPMKDSGIEWLGEVPESWKVVRVKHIIWSIEQGWSPQCEGFPVETPEEWGVLKVGCVNGGIFNPAENKALPTKFAPLPELGISAGDLLISRANTRELVGSAAVAVECFSNLLLCDKLYRLRTKPDNCLPLYLARYLGADRVRNRIELAASGASSSMLNIAQSTVLEMPIALPVLEEQHAIVSFLTTEAEKLDALMKEARQAIDLLKERRSALTSAVVTGKIDVRGLVVNQSE